MILNIASLLKQHDKELFYKLIMNNLNPANVERDTNSKFLSNILNINDKRLDIRLFDESNIYESNIDDDGTNDVNIEIVESDEEVSNNNESFIITEVELVNLNVSEYAKVDSEEVQSDACSEYFNST